MCGIHAAICPDGNPPRLTAHLERCLRQRGPDHLGTATTLLPRHPGLRAHFTSTVLALRGDHVARQPLVHAQGSILCWNGEAWKIRGEGVAGQTNDAEAVLALLVAAAGEGGVLNALRQVEGPFAFVFFDARTGSVFFGRDRLGRRSLLVKRRKEGGGLVLSSVAEEGSDDWAEVDADGCYTVDVDTGGELITTRHAWDEDEDLVLGLGAFNASLPGPGADALTRASPSVRRLREMLAESVRLRVSDVPAPPGASGTDARVAVLFSGGLDCTVLARMACDVLPPGQPVDLLNVAFENPRIAALRTPLAGGDLYELCPDRVTGRKAFAELLAVRPARPWRFVTINVPYAETAAHRAEVMRLMYPHNTEMDLSISLALFFAARGAGLAHTPPRGYTTPARVLLSGLGADELFGGYVRHATAYQRASYPGLLAELRLDMARLGRRNLGRDDRVMARWGREVRFPYLDEALVRWAVGLPVREKCGFGGEPGGLEPGKKVLRLLAEELGMGGVAGEKKRAIQFGARTAKMESGRVKGTTLL